MKEIWRRALRRIIACGLAYLVALQGVAFAFGGFEPDISANDISIGDFQLCHHDPEDSPGQPAQIPGADTHCPLCFIGTLCLNSTPPLVVVGYTAAYEEVAWPSFPGSLITPVLNQNAWPRGPPLVD